MVVRESIQRGELMKKGFFLLLTIGILGFSAPQIKSLCEGFVPDNDLWISADLKSPQGITEADFNDVISKVEKYYSSIISDRGGSLMVRRLWNDGTVNASAQQIFTFWIVNMYGGLARHKTITKDGFSLVMCHELGHHIGGSPKIGSMWASNEGQSDYFANLKCLRRVWWNDNNISIIENMENVDPVAEQKCANAFENDNEAAICIRGAMAGRSVANLFQELREESTQAQFNTPDQTQASETNDKHPGTQCRLDTYFQGSLCEADHLTDVNRNDPRVGTCNRSTGHTEGIRPLCWYKP